MERTIEGQKRTPGSKPNALRREGKLPAVLYGHDGANSVELVVDAKAVEVLLKHSSPNKSVIQLNVPEMSWSGKTIIKEVQSHPAKGHLYHVSFCATDA